MEIYEFSKEIYTISKEISRNFFKKSAMLSGRGLAWRWIALLFVSNFFPQLPNDDDKDIDG